MLSLSFNQFIIISPFPIVLESSGDSGGCLGIFEGNELTLAGIVSYGSDKGCELGNPEVYTKVSSYLSWIHNKTGIQL